MCNASNLALEITYLKLVLILNKQTKCYVETSNNHERVHKILKLHLMALKRIESQSLKETSFFVLWKLLSSNVFLTLDISDIFLYTNCRSHYIYLEWAECSTFVCYMSSKSHNMVRRDISQTINASCLITVKNFGIQFNSILLLVLWYTDSKVMPAVGFKAWTIKHMMGCMVIKIREVFGTRIVCPAIISIRQQNVRLSTLTSLWIFIRRPYIMRK